MQGPDRGYDVTVVCPKEKDDPAHEVLDGVTLLKYRPTRPGAARSASSGVRLLVPGDRRCAACSPPGKFDVLQACNPPDIFWPIARWLRRRDGRGSFSITTTSVRSSTTRASRWQVACHAEDCLPWRRRPSARRPRRGHERLIRRDRGTPRRQESRGCHGSAHRPRPRAAATGEPRSGAAARPAAPCRLHRRHGAARRRRPGGSAAAHVVHDLGRDDVAFTFMGAGDSYDEIVALRDELGLQDYLELPAVSTTPSSTCSRRPLSGFHPTRRTRSTTSPR